MIFSFFFNRLFLEEILLARADDLFVGILDFHLFWVLDIEFLKVGLGTLYAKQELYLQSASVLIQCSFFFWYCSSAHTGASSCCSYRIASFPLTQTLVNHVFSPFSFIEFSLVQPSVRVFSIIPFSKTESLGATDLSGDYFVKHAQCLHAINKEHWNWIGKCCFIILRLLRIK